MINWLCNQRKAYGVFFIQKNRNFKMLNNTVLLNIWENRNFYKFLTGMSASIAFLKNSIAAIPCLSVSTGTLSYRFMRRHTDVNCSNFWGVGKLIWWKLITLFFAAIKRLNSCIACVNMCLCLCYVLLWMGLNYMMLSGENW